MERYIGMDVHAASCTLAVISEKGRKLKDFPVETNDQALVEAIRMIPGRKHLVMEEGLQSAWLYETLSPHVDELVVAGITQRNKDPIHARYERLLDGGTKPTLAKLSLARIIAATVLRMWKNEEEYDPGRAGLPTQTCKG
jgi:hypothetical protein